MHEAIAGLLKTAAIELNNIDAVAVSSGPGSYTGLRVGMATAKGFCYALNCPLITLNTLKIMAFAAKPGNAELLCPMIDARRMEVFTAVFNKELEEIVPAGNMILDEQSFAALLSGNKVRFFGNGSKKWKAISPHPNAIFSETEASALHMIELAENRWLEQDFASLAYAEPFYGKDFHSPGR